MNDVASLSDRQRQELFGQTAANGVRAAFHRPHPQKETDNGAVKSMRRFLTEAGVTP